MHEESFEAGKSWPGLPDKLGRSLRKIVDKTKDKANSKASTTEEQGKLADRVALDRLYVGDSFEATDPEIMMTEEHGRLAERLALVQLSPVGSGNGVQYDNGGDIGMA
ncbi:hypothetical protein SBOR_10122 [Sclerotinia borealis F-4128]|uniref:Uncharacterized protein n=1 Tax=Sclerotinia borealis (strain F-4128) TaxID=1432307 RepID=W9C3I7_SCLBF|nr:hypothetical protein SBOR_10122 [Sclerotinia borealis F-4128]